MEDIKEVAKLIKKSKSCVALTGAGISVESGIPDFRSPGGLWSKYDPSYYASIEVFIKHPAKIWNMIFEMLELIVNAKPNNGHLALADLEKNGYLKTIVTQNIDNLHQRAGNKNVIEFHGNAGKLQCMKCGKKYDVSKFDLSTKIPPKCEECNKILKPTVVFFGEMIPFQALKQSQSIVKKSDLLLVIGTSAEVFPAAGVPIIAHENGAKVVEINLTSSAITKSITDIFLQGNSDEILPQLVEALGEI